MARPDGRAVERTSPVESGTGYKTSMPKDSCLIRMGDTVVLCTASVTQSVPARLRSGVGLGTVVVSCS
jgi:ribonuclease PH